MKNPEEYCVNCGEGYYPFDESCRSCGFDPVNDEDDAIRDEEARIEYATFLREREQK